MKTALVWCYRKATGWHVVGLLLLQLLFELIVWPKLLPQIDTGKTGVLDTLAHPFTPLDAYRHLTSYQASGRAIYLLTELLVDPLYILSYGSLGLLLFSYFLKNLVRTYALSWYLPVLLIGAPIFDLLENVGFIFLLVSYPSRVDFWATWSNLFSLLKWGFILVNLFLLMSSGSLWLYNYLKSRKVVKQLVSIFQRSDLKP